MNAPDWFPFFGGYPIEVYEHAVVFRDPVSLQIAYVMSSNDYHAVLDLAETMEQRARVMKAVEAMQPAVDPEVSARLLKEFEESKK